MACLPQETIHAACNNLSQVQTSYHQYKSYWGDLDDQRKQGILCDVVLQCGSHSYNAHKCILAAASPYFKGLFSSPVSHIDNQQIVDFDHYSTKTIQLLLDIIYGEYVVESADLAELLQLAEFLQYNWLVDILIDSIRNTINETNCFSWHKIGKEAGVRKLVVLAEGYITVNHDKLCNLEEHQTYINDVLPLGEPGLDKDVMLYYNNDSIYVIDISKKTVENWLDGPCNITELSPPNPQECDSVYSFFMYKKELFLASFYFFNYDKYEAFVSYPCVSNNKHIQINRYNHCSREYVQVRSFRSSDLVQGHGYTLSLYADVMQLVYDNLDALYILLQLPENKYVVRKFDLGKARYSDNYIMSEGYTLGMVFVESKQLGTLLVNYKGQVYNIEEFDFNEGDNRGLDPLEISGWEKGIAKFVKHKLQSENCDYKYSIISLNGEIYFFAAFRLNEWKKLIVLHLNIEKLSWVYLCDLPVPGNFKNAFCYHGKIFVVVSPMEHGQYCSCEEEQNCYLSEFNNTYNMDDVFNCLYCFDRDKGTLTDMDIKLPFTGRPYKACVVPAYLLV